MKVLCLHGRGSSGAIFRSQTSSIRSRLTDLNLTFDFIDGPYPCGPAPGLDLFYRAPYYSFYADTETETEASDNKTLNTIHQTQSWLESVTRERGPYDLVLTFSQGASVAVTALLLHAVEVGNQRRKAGCKSPAQAAAPLPSPEEEQDEPSGMLRTSDEKDKMPPPPFKSAIFICGGAPHQLLEEIGYSISPLTKARDDESRAVLSSMASSESILSRGSARWTGSPLDFSIQNPYPTPLATPTHNLGLSLSPFTFEPQPHTHNNTHLDSLSLSFHAEDEIRREIVGSVKVSIPTVHIYGERDPRYVAGIQLSEVCVKKKRKVYNHGGGHEIPRYEAVSGAIADLVRWAVWAAQDEYEGV
ncbi:putative EF-hand calcium-binding domain protein [Aspergillus undulatus]|uniref:putative EF-hand calcium-binding domain protein n=1 Tax=Aspergillus undulatus TaxID=1810928 RepID=UPI003CCCF7AC